MIKGQGRGSGQGLGVKIGDKVGVKFGGGSRSGGQGRVPWSGSRCWSPRGSRV